MTGREGFWLVLLLAALIIGYLFVSAHVIHIGSLFVNYCPSSCDIGGRHFVHLGGGWYWW